MKTLFNFNILLGVTAVLFLISCVKSDDYELPEIEVSEVSFDGNLTTIAAVKGHFDFESEDIYTFQNTGVAMEGYVVSSDEGGNFYKKLVLQDRSSNPTSGIQVLIDDASLFNTYDFGRKIYVKLDGLSLGYNNGNLQLGIQNRGNVVAIPKPLIDEHLLKTSETAAIEPLRLDIRDFNESFKNLYIKLENVQFNLNLFRDDRPLTFAAETTDQFDGVRQLESCETGATSMLSTSTFADFRSLLLPEASGGLSGVLTRDFYDDFFIIVLNTPEDLSFEDGARCDPEFFKCGENSTPGVEIVFQESFETITTLRMLETRGWTNVNVSGGSVVFKPGTLGGNRHLRISAYNTIEAPLEAWLVTPAIDLEKTDSEVLAFDLRSSFDNATILRVYISDSYSGNPLTTSWKLLDAEIPLGPSNQAATFFKRTHVDISCLQGTVHVAFRYMGGIPDKTTTYDVDNIRVTGNK
ncbi:DUF5689 domain-containing protein [Gillisia limnaea]|uniref:DUF5689 domain-containing protein n=1 Tax=Gillisia limnaea (strain DSM 15749 / LMG 21470 / R-8282) TaxID=865937 RepID=H2BSK7_GILLR|nr:DUF5689 domain-containing protein [Gillisia limnaea]EHQ02554.1 hypothetical protein Gilli_1913 [Gillisia limnaea DSM 15749]